MKQRHRYTKKRLVNLERLKRGDRKVDSEKTENDKENNKNRWMWEKQTSKESIGPLETNLLLKPKKKGSRKGKRWFRGKRLKVYEEQKHKIERENNEIRRLEIHRGIDLNK